MSELRQDIQSTKIENYKHPGTISKMKKENEAKSKEMIELREHISKVENNIASI